MSNDLANFCKLLLIKIFYIFFRFQYPERPTLFFAICYMIVSLICLIGLVMPEAIVCSTEKINLDQVVEHGTGLIQGATQRPCTIIFMLFFYFSSKSQSTFFAFFRKIRRFTDHQNYFLIGLRLKSNFMVWIHIIKWILYILRGVLTKISNSSIIRVIFLASLTREVDFNWYFGSICSNTWALLKIVFWKFGQNQGPLHSSPSRFKIKHVSQKLFVGI